MPTADDKYVLGIWDGHDAGAVLLKGDRIVFAVNEERLSRRKLDVGFPFRSIRACLDHEGIGPLEIRDIALSTGDPAKTLTRWVPGLAEAYYLIRRRKRPPGRLDPLKKRFKYRFTELGPNALSRPMSRWYAKRQLRSLGFQDFNLSLPDHHLCHAHAAARSSGFDECLVVTLDGVGDGLSGSIRRFREGRLEHLKAISAKTSLGIFFEHVTNLMNMRELEDEGKVMALANYAYPVNDEDNPLMDIIRTEGLDLVSPYRSTGMFRELKRVLWRFPSEQFAFMAQKALERNALNLIGNALSLTGAEKIALAGGVFSNVKLNMRIAEMDEITNVFVFPHMGDGGLAMGAAMGVNHERFAVPGYALGNLYLGPRFSEKDLVSTLKKSGISFRPVEDPAKVAAGLIMKGEIVLWFRGRMEVGPRALGNRSILARPDRTEIKDRLNLALKKRVWYQPFCPSILSDDAASLLRLNGQDVKDNRFMTSAFKVRERYKSLMQGVMNVDGTCRPHFVGDENPMYRDLLLRIQEALGKGVILNTSFNIHGEPMVCSPDDALDMLERTPIRYLFLENFLVEKRG